MTYAMVTVKLNKPAMPKERAFTEIKKSLNLSAPDIDENYGAMPMGKNDEYVVCIEESVAQKLKDAGHPNIIGVFSNPKFEPFGQPQPKRTDSRWSPKGPKF